MHCDRLPHVCMGILQVRGRALTRLNALQAAGDAQEQSKAPLPAHIRKLNRAAPFNVSVITTHKLQSFF